MRVRCAYKPGRGWVVQGADQESAPVPESAWFADDPGPCSVIDESLAASPGSSLPVTFTPYLHACEVHVLTAGEVRRLPGTISTATGVPLESTLPRLVLIELRRPGDACLFLHEGRLAGGSPCRVSALYVLDPPARCPSASSWEICSMRSWRFSGPASTPSPAALRSFCIPSAALTPSPAGPLYNLRPVAPPTARCTSSGPGPSASASTGPRPPAR